MLKDSSRLTHSRLYLQRLGYDTPPAPTLETLAQLQLRHVCTFAFENLSVLSQLPVPLDLASIEQKVLFDGRGGYCYELNQMFLALLQELGFDARGITGRVVIGGPPDAHTSRTHRLALVTLAGVRYISDVAFGGMVPSSPLQLDNLAPQATAHEPYRLTLNDASYTLWAQVGEEWRGLYVFDLQSQSHFDYEVGNWYVSTHPDSPFMNHLKVALVGPGLRRTLNNGHYAIHYLGRDSEKHRITDVDELLALLREAFALRVPDYPPLRAKLVQLLADS
ncbi:MULTISPECIES: arylamine N-acetyltransferase family protein [Pseudomonas]|uniref:Arylamine N-acetyltransferase n=1 Tax=Pseudomonas gessardii TaxID=78544 RepID=A0ABS9F1M6_9PSED|nr:MULTISPECIES: arylamine N-acetyltransferase [Pseudomonas]MCF4980489.1 arylamine N-acetyltransferase [Pseudomonas gessardii]MCF4993678.1 arylamine N-acetyltransferase [Pseudomonas gessardii]MCF5085706.1 arylamine N-acetyltransferase [Pseudomonas gessardii]MCF5096753.1 arylamine N-acetyltransferase [Pseudomonas gessardii]MCF5106291.1 arylamine N-acetyltransferase [Pseudomonas gessardii]